jgi:hypothetical protein
MSVLHIDFRFILGIVAMMSSFTACGGASSVNSDDASKNKYGIAGRNCIDLIESLEGPVFKTGIVACPVREHGRPDYWVDKLAASCADPSRVPPPTHGTGWDDDHCQVDAECGSDRACVCGAYSPESAIQNRSRCLPAQCEGASDCPEGPCALSLDECLTPTGLYCHASSDLCTSNEDCGDKGDLCSYSIENRRFECIKSSVCDIGPGWE